MSDLGTKWVKIGTKWDKSAKLTYLGQHLAPLSQVAPMDVPHSMRKTTTFTTKTKLLIYGKSQSEFLLKDKTMM